MIGSTRGPEPLAEDAHPEGYETISSASVPKAVQRVLERLYRGLTDSPIPVTDLTPALEQRNRAIYERYLAGERAVDLAREFGISVVRVNRLVRRYQNRGNS